MTRIFSMFSLLLFTQLAWGASFQIKDIQLEGLQRVSASPVFAALPVRTGDTVDSEDVRSIIQSLLGTGFFRDIQVGREGDVLVIFLTERPAIKSIELDGNKKLKTEQLMEVLGDNGLSEGEIFQSHTLQAISQSIENQYIGQARYDANVVTSVDQLANNLVDIKIEIDEGDPASIKHYNIVGNKKFSDEELQSIFELGVSKWYWPFSSSDKYAKERLTGDLETLESFYLDRGYLDFQASSTQVSVSPDKKSVYITINVSEGDVYKVKDIDLAGDPILSEARIRRLILLGKGFTFSQAAMTRTSEYITTTLGNSGYTNAKVEGITEKNKETKEVDVTFFIDPGKRTYVRRVNFNGNTKTGDNVLRREMRQLEGAPASNSKIEQSKVRLERLGFFKSVNVETVNVPGSDDLIDVNFDVEEQPSGSISASVGYADFSGFNLGFSISESNWLGSGNNVSLGVNRNTFQENYTFSYTDPYFTVDGVTRGISLYHRLTDYDEVSFSGSYSTDSTGIDINFGYPVSEVSFLRFGVGYNIQAVTTGVRASQQIAFSPLLREGTELAYIRQSDYETYRDGPLTEGGIPQEYSLDTFTVTEDELQLGDELGFIDKYGTEFGSTLINATWSRRTLNRGVLATRGNSQSLRFEASVPSSDLEYYKLTYDAQMFQPISKSLTLRFKTRLGFGDGYGEMDELPFFENFRAGGFGSVRGFERYTLGPKIVPADIYTLSSTGWVDLNNNGVAEPSEFTSPGRAYVLCEDPTSFTALGCEPGKLISNRGAVTTSSASSFGGNVLMEFSTELLLPIPFVEDSRSMQLVAFVDAGNVFSTNCLEDQLNCYEPDFSELSSSYGLGFKWLSAMGPLTFSFARPINKSDLDQTKFFDFTFGAGF